MRNVNVYAFRLKLHQQKISFHLNHFQYIYLIHGILLDLCSHTDTCEIFCQWCINEYTPISRFAPQPHHTAYGNLCKCERQKHKIIYITLKNEIQKGKKKNYNRSFEELEPWCCMAIFFFFLCKVVKIAESDRLFDIFY